MLLRHHYRPSTNRLLLTTANLPLTILLLLLPDRRTATSPPFTIQSHPGRHTIQLLLNTTTTSPRETSASAFRWSSARPTTWSAASATTKLIRDPNWIRPSPPTTATLSLSHNRKDAKSIRFAVVVRASTTIGKRSSETIPSPSFHPIPPLLNLLSLRPAVAALQVPLPKSQ